jgi:hypothetical protein
MLELTDWPVMYTDQTVIMYMYLKQKVYKI